MTTQSPFYAIVVRFAMLLALACGSAHADPANSDEASLGAAAIVVLAQKCNPGQVGHYQTQAQSHLSYMLQRFSETAKARIFEDLRIKIKALQVSSSMDSCAGAQRLQSMATHWGYAHILETMTPAQ